MATEQKQFSKFGAACYQGDLAAIAKFLEGGLHPDAYPYNALGDSVLMAAIRNDKLEVVKLLVEGGASFEYAGDQGTPLTYALKYDRKDIIEYLAARGAPISWTPPSELPQADKDARVFDACDDWTGDESPKRIAEMLAAGANPNARVDGLTPLLALAAVDASGPQLYKALLDGGADPALTDEEGNTAFHRLSRGARLSKEATLFLEAGLPIDTRNAAGETPLHCAAGAGYWDALKFVKWLVDKGADPLAKDNAGRTPADLASGDSKKWLLNKTTPPLSDDDKALLAAVGKGDVDKVKQLCDAGANPCIVDTSDKTYGPNSVGGAAALHVAMNKRLPHEIAEYLIARAGDVDTRDLQGKTALHHVLDRNDGATRGPLVEQLLARGADPNAADQWGSTPVFELTSFYEMTDELALIDRLQAAGAELDHKTGGGETLLDVLYEKTQRFNEINDKKGFVALMQKVMEVGVSTGDPDMRAHVDTWLRAKGAKYSSTLAPPPPAAEPPKLGIDLSPAGKLYHEDSYFDLEGEHEAVACFDWLEMERAEDEDESTEASQIWEYHIHEGLAEPVKEYKIVPFGIVGMSGSFDSYQEIATYGTLFVINSRAKDGDAPVLFIPNSGTIHRLTENDEPRPLPLTFKQLFATYAKKPPAAEKKPAQKAAAKKPAAKKPAAKKPAAKKPAKKPAAKKPAAKKAAAKKPAAKKPAAKAKKRR